MPVVARLLAILAVALVAAQPVMACCLTGHAEAPGTLISAEPSCHGDAPGMAADAGGGAGDPADTADCPWSPDCDRAIMEAQSVPGWSVLTSAPSEMPVQIVEARDTVFGPRLAILATGPPPAPAIIPFLTPVTLKQRLLN